MKYLTKKQAAEYLTTDIGIPTTVKTLSMYITNGSGPKYHKFSNRVFYTIDAINDWIETKMSHEFTNSCTARTYNNE